MKKIIFLLLIVCLSGLKITVMAQVKLSLYGGPQITTAKYRIQGKKQDTEFKPGFQLGTGLKVPFDNKLFFTPAIFYSLKGYKVKFNLPSLPPDENALNNSTSIHSVELAFLLQYDFSTAADHWFIKAGPTLDFALFGKEKFDTAGSVTVSRNMKFGFGDYGHYLASGVIQLGMERKSGFFVFVQYNGSFGSIINTDGGPYAAHRIWGISVGKYIRTLK